jgi:hypothetical protein
MEKFLILGLAAAAIALLGQPSFANPPQQPIVMPHPMAKAPAFRPQPLIGGQHAAFGQHPGNGFLANRPGFGQQRPGFSPVNHPGQFIPGNHGPIDPRIAHGEQVRRDEQLHRDQLAQREQLRDEHAVREQERERQAELIRVQRHDQRIDARQQLQADQADQSAPADDSSASADDSSAPADASSGSNLADTLSTVKSVLDLFKGGKSQ